jgi:hypothetical protein
MAAIGTGLRRCDKVYDAASIIIATEVKPIERHCPVGQFDPRRMSLGKLEDIGGFLAEIPLAAKAPRHRHDIGCGGTDHLDLAVVQ